MKKLVFLFAAVFLTAVSANVFAQNTGATPSPGSTFSYKVTDNGNDYQWSVTEGDLSTSPTSAGIIISLPTSDSTGITWGGVTVGDTYYVHVVETDIKGCSNEKVMKVTISESEFYLTMVADSSSAVCYDGPVSVSLSAGEPVYDHGNATVSYTITPSNLGSATGYSFAIDETITPVVSGTNFSAVPSVTSGNGSISGGTVTVNNTSAVKIEFAVSSSDTFDNTTDPDGDKADFNHALEITSGSTSLGVAENGTDGTYVANTDAARPHTTTISFN